MTKSNVFTFVVAVSFQFLGISLLPATRGMTVLMPSVIVVLSFMIGVVLLSRLMNAGASLSFLVPLQASILPLLMIAVGLIFYKEPAAPLRISMLVAASLLIAGSNFLPVMK